MAEPEQRISNQGNMEGLIVGGNAGAQELQDYEEEIGHFSCGRYKDFKSKKWIFTSFHADGKDIEKLVKPSNEHVRHLVFQLEQCPRTGRQHWQGFLWTKNGVLGSTLQNTIKDRCYIAPARGNIKQCIDYCSKLETRIAGPFIKGEKPDDEKQGERSDLKKAADDILSGMGMEEIAEKYGSRAIMYGRGMNSLISVASKKRSKDRQEVNIHYMGSMEAAIEDAEERDLMKFYISPGKDSWHGYEGEEILILDPEKWNWKVPEWIFKPFPMPMKRGYEAIFPCWTIILMTCTEKVYIDKWLGRDEEYYRTVAHNDRELENWEWARRNGLVD